MKKIRCPKCGHKGSFKVAVWGTAMVTEEDKDLDIISLEIDNKDYAECPECEYQTYDFREFHTDEDFKPVKRAIKCPGCGSNQGYSLYLDGRLEIDGDGITSKHIETSDVSCENCLDEFEESDFYPDGDMPKFDIDLSVKEIF